MDTKQPAPPELNIDEFQLFMANLDRQTEAYIKFRLRYFAPAILALAERVEEAENVVAVLEPAKGAINGKGLHKALTEAVAENKRLREQIALHAGDCLLLQNEIDNLIAQDEPSAYLVSPPSVTFLRDRYGAYVNVAHIAWICTMEMVENDHRPRTIMAALTTRAFLEMELVPLEKAGTPNAEILKEYIERVGLW